MALICPGSTTTALVTGGAGTAAVGLAALDPRFLAILTQAEVDTAHMKLLGDAGCKSSQIYGYIGKTEEKLLLFLKRVLNLDPEVRGEDSIPAAKLTIAWEACRKRAEVEVEANAQRAVNRLPPQLTIDDHSAARDALEAKMAAESKAALPDHKVPSENYFEKKCGEIETWLRAEKLSSVTNFAQEENMRTPNAPPTTGDYMDFDSRGTPTMKTQKKDFYVPMPTNEAGLRNRLDVMGAMFEMMRLRYMANPIIATASIDAMRTYADHLCGQHVWGFVVNGANGPLACPSIRQVLVYDQAIRELAAKLMKGGRDFKSAMEAAMGDTDTRMLNFTTPFGMEAHTAECKALTAPALQEIYAKLPAVPKGQKRPLALEDGSFIAGQSVSAKKRARAKVNKDKKKTDQGKGTGPKKHLAILDGSIGGGGTGGKSKAKGKDKGKGKTKSGIPKGIKSKTADGKGVCFAHNKGERCAEEPCTFAHTCWWCLGAGCDFCPK